MNKLNGRSGIKSPSIVAPYKKFGGWLRPGSGIETLAFCSVALSNPRRHARESAAAEHPARSIKES